MTTNTTPFSAASASVSAAANTAGAEPDTVTISVLCAEESLASFCRRLAAAVNPGPMHLARVFAVATQVYPVRVDAMWGEATVLNCEFRMRRAGAAVDAGSAGAARTHRVRVRSPWKCCSFS